MFENLTFVIELLGPYKKGSEHTAAEGVGTGLVQQSFEITVAEPPKAEFAQANEDSDAIPDEGLLATHGAFKEFRIKSPSAFKPWHVLRVKLKDSNQGLTNDADRKAIFDGIEVIADNPAATDFLRRSWHKTFLGKKVTSNDHMSIPVRHKVNIGLKFTDANSIGKNFTVELLSPFDESIGDDIAYSEYAQAALAASASATAGTAIDTFDINVLAPTAKILKADNSRIPDEGTILLFAEDLQLKFDDLGSAGNSYVARLKFKGGYKLNAAQNELDAAQKEQLFSTATVRVAGSEVPTTTSADHMSFALTGDGRLDLRINYPKAGGKDFTLELLGPYPSDSLYLGANGVGTTTGARIHQAFDFTVNVRPGRITLRDGGAIPTQGLLAPSLGLTDDAAALAKFTIPNGGEQWHAIRIDLKDGHGFNNFREIETYKRTFVNENKGDYDDWYYGITPTNSRYAVPIKKSDFIKFNFTRADAAGKTFVVKLFGPYATQDEAKDAERRNALETVIQSFEIKFAPPEVVKLFDSVGNPIRNGKVLRTKVGDSMDFQFADYSDGFYSSDSRLHWNGNIQIKLKNIDDGDGNPNTIQGLNAEQRTALFKHGSGVHIWSANYSSPQRETSEGNEIRIWLSTDIKIKFLHPLAANKIFTVEVAPQIGNRYREGLQPIVQTFDIAVAPATPPVYVRDQRRQIPLANGATIHAGVNYPYQFGWETANSLNDTYIFRLKLKDLDDGDNNPSTIQGLTSEQRMAIFTKNTGVNMVLDNRYVSSTTSTPAPTHFSSAIRRLKNAGSLGMGINFKNSLAAGKTFTVELLGPYPNNSPYFGANGVGSTAGAKIVQTFNIKVADDRTAHIVKEGGGFISDYGLWTPNGRPLKLKYVKLKNVANSHVLRIKLKDTDGVDDSDYNPNTIQGMNAAQRTAIFNANSTRYHIQENQGGIQIQGGQGTGVGSADHRSIAITQSGTITLNFNHSTSGGKTYTVELLGPYPSGSPYLGADGVGSTSGARVQQIFDIEVVAPWARIYDINPTYGDGAIGKGGSADRLFVPPTRCRGVRTNAELGLDDSVGVLNYAEPDIYILRLKLHGDRYNSNSGYSSTHPGNKISISEQQRILQNLRLYQKNDFQAIPTRSREHISYMISRERYVKIKINDIFDKPWRQGFKQSNITFTAELLGPYSFNEAHLGAHGVGSYPGAKVQHKFFIPVHTNNYNTGGC